VTAELSAAVTANTKISPMARSIIPELGMADPFEHVCLVRPLACGNNLTVRDKPACRNLFR